MKIIETFQHWTGDRAAIVEVPDRNVLFIVPETFPIEAVDVDCPLALIRTNKARTYSWDNKTVFAEELKEFTAALTL